MRRSGNNLLLPLLAAVALAGGCAEIPQIPGQGGVFEVRSIGACYAVSVDLEGRLLGIWDLAYPVLERDLRGDLWGAYEERTFPVRLVNFQDPGESVRILEDEAWRFGVNSWFGAAVSVGYLKWVLSTELFDVREIRKFRNAALAEYLAHRSPGDPVLAAAGLGSVEVRHAAEQLDPEVYGPRGDLEGTVRADLRVLLEDLALRTRAILDEPGFFHGPVDELAWERVGDRFGDGQGYPFAGSGKDRVIAMQEAVRGLLAGIDRWRIRPELFGKGQRLALVHLVLDRGELPFGLYDLSGEQPALVVPLIDLLAPPGPVDENASLALAEVGAVTVLASNFLIGELVGFPFPLPGLLLNTITSIWPTAPFREEDPHAAACGRILALVSDPEAPVPAFLAGHAAEVAARVNRRMVSANRYWLRASRQPELVEIHRRKLEAASRESMHQAVFGSGAGG